MLRDRVGKKRVNPMTRPFKCFSIIAILMLSFAFISGCTSTQDQGSDGKIEIVTTIGMITDIVEQVGKDKVAVHGLMGAGVDPHLYKATQGDVQRLSDAQIIFYGGLHLEAKMAEVLEEIGSRKVAIAVTKDIPKEMLLDFPAYPGQYDPHVWFDVSLWQYAVKTVRDTLKEADPENAALYEQNAQQYLLQLDALNAYVLSEAQKVPPEQRVLVTAHDAFQYFGKQYGFEVMGLQGISTEAQAGTKDVQELVDFVVARKIRSVFVESSVPQRNIEAVQQAAKSKGWDVKIGGSLYSDAMGDHGTKEGTYIGMVTHNIDTIVAGLK